MQKQGSQRLTEASPAPTGMLAWLGFGITCFALACLLLAFCSPYWLQTWPMSENRFRNMGLWHVCFYNYMQFKDDSQQVYSGCWWVFDTQPKYYKLREWLTPPWFITCQVLTTGSLLVEITVVAITGLIFLHCCPLMNHEYLQTYAMFGAGAMMMLVTMVLFVVGIVFGVQVNDRYWLPRPDQNYLSWGFGFMVISMICSLAAGVLLFKSAWDCYQELLRKEDDYTQKALEMSAAGLELSSFPGAEDTFALVPPGFSHMPPSYAKPLSEGDGAVPVTYGTKAGIPAPPDYYTMQSSLSPTGGASIPTSEEKAALVTKPKEQPMWSPVKSDAEVSFGAREPASFSSPVGAEGPRDAGTFGRGGFDPLRDFDGFGGKSYDQPSAYGGKSFDQPSKFGKSYDRNFERRYSDESFNDPEEDTGPSKPERQY